MSDSSQPPHVPRLYRLAEAVKLFFPDTGLTAKALRNEARHGRLQIIRVGGKLYVSADAIAAMLERCVLPAESLPTSQPGALHSDLSLAEREKRAQAAIQLMLPTRKRRK